MNKKNTVQTKNDAIEEISSVQRELRRLGDPQRAGILQRFFKTGPGEYAEGDKFLGITVPQTRKLVRKYSHLTLNQVQTLLGSDYHEERLLAVLILVAQFKKADAELQQRIFRFYVKNKRYVNNWDLVDSSSPVIVGGFLRDKERTLLYDYAQSKNLWDRRIAIMSTFTFIRVGDFSDSLALARILLRDSHDLIHKAVGWMLREIGKRDLTTEERFLDAHSSQMPRTMLRYAIEKFDKNKKQHYLGKKPA